MRKAFVGLAVLAMLVSSTSDAFAQTIAWTDQFGSERFDVAWGVLASTTDVYVAGLTGGALPGETSAGGIDGFVRHLDPSGNEIWKVQFGTAKDDFTFQVATDATGLYVMGQTSGTFPGQTKAGGSDAFLKKFGFDGTELWTVQFGTPEDDNPSNLVADATGLYIFGSTWGAFPGETNLGDADLFLTRFDSDGNQDWTQQFGTSRFDVGYANAIGPDGIYVNGWTDGRLPDQRDRGDLDAYVGLFQIDGTLTWLRQFGTSRFDLGLGIVADATGVYVSGGTDGVFKDQRDRAGQDAYVRKFAPTDGSTLWTRQFGTADFDVCNALALVGSDVACVGDTDGAFRDQTSAGKRDVFVKTFDAATGGSGGVLQFGTRGNDVGNWATSATDALYVVGMTTGRLGEAALGQEDAYVMRIDVSAVQPYASTDVVT